MYKKFIALILSLAVAGAIIVDGYLLFFKKQTTNTKVSTESTSNQSTASASANSTMKDGTYTGAATSTAWGDVQVKMTVANGKITSITVLKHPTEGKSVQINAEALPIYKKEAIAAQSAKIQQVSGATETYKGFTGSLQSAITQAEEAS